MRYRVVLLSLMFVACAGWARGASVVEAAREIPVAYDVDVLVVGGGTGAAAAALAAKRNGASVFLAAPNPYLGDDMTSTLRLWLEPDEVPASDLAKAVYHDPRQQAVGNRGIPFTYRTDVTAAARHPDADHARLRDGKWGSASNQSAQYDNDVVITAVLDSPRAVDGVRLWFYRRPLNDAPGDGFDVGSMSVEVSEDGETWRDAGTVENTLPREDASFLTQPVGATLAQARIRVTRKEGFDRMLLGELEFLVPMDPTDPPLRPMPRPMHIKKTLDARLVEAGVQYLYSTLPTDVLIDKDGAPCGIVMANRAGRQAVMAKHIVDATPRSAVARMAGASFHPYPRGTRTFEYVVVGGGPREGDGMTHRQVDPPFPATQGNTSCPVIVYQIPLPIDGDRFVDFMKIEQTVRTLTYHPDQQFTSDWLFEVPPDPMVAVSTAAGPWRGADAIPLAALQPRGVANLHVLGGCVDASREQAKELLRPLALMDLGERLGAEIAAKTKTQAVPAGVRVQGLREGRSAAHGFVKEFLRGVRPTQRNLPTVRQPERDLPVLAEVDVVVVGGGTGGAPAGIGAARQGARTLVLEYLHGLGGVGTYGAIASYYWGNRVGFTKTVLDGAAKWQVEQKAEWYRQALLEAGGDIWYGVLGCGAWVEDNLVKGCVVTTPHGRGVVLAHAVIDATGNSDIAAAAGAETLYTDSSEFGMQGTGLPGRKLGGAYNNTDFTVVDETDLVDVWHMLVYSKDKYAGAFDHGRLIDTRERRRVIGDFTIRLTDQINQRTYPDSVVQCYSNFDTHGYTLDPLLLVAHPEKVGVYVYIPYRAMLPKGLDGILVTGLGISAHRDAIPLIRMQPDIQNGGYAAGVAAAMAAREQQSIRSIDVKTLQAHLVEIGNLPASVLTDQDSYPLPNEVIAEAVRDLPSGTGASIILSHPGQARPLVEQAYRASSRDNKVVYAKVLAILGSPHGSDTLQAEVAAHSEWDPGWNYRGMGQFGAAFSELDALIMALGLFGDPAALPVILDKAATLDATRAFSHHRAVGRALELIGDPAAAPVLADLLSKPDMTGHVHRTVTDAATRGVSGGTNAEQTRRESLRELLLARALYRCGDHDQLGASILENYTHDLRGHLARHAQAVLESDGWTGL